MKKAHPYILKFLALVCLSSLFAVTAIPSVSHAEEADGELLLFWAPIALPASSALARLSDNSLIRCSDGLEGLSEGRCGDNSFVSLQNTMSPCTIDTIVSCINNLEIQLPNQSWKSASYLGTLSPPQTSWSSFPQFDLGPANDSSIFTTTNGSGSQIQWLVSISYLFNASKISSGVTGPSDYTISIAPVQKITANECVWNTRFESLLLIAGGAINFRDYCYKRLQQPSSFKARLALSMAHEPRGWITSYLQQFEGKIQQPTDKNQKYELTLEGSNSPYPISALTISGNDSERKSKFCSVNDPTYVKRCTEKSSWVPSLYFYRTTGGYRDNGKDKYLAMLSLFPELDVAAKENIAWSVDLDMRNEDKINSCSAPKGIYGVVGGNAMLIDESVPIWNASTQTLEFGVASPHYKSDGQVARGFYEMQLNEQVAKCLWGTKVTPANVSLSVLDENGDSKVATAAISVKNGMVIFRATGFTYSSTKLSVSLKKLVCAKNGMTKTQPKGKTTCPKGWKKKQ
jgi:hypothetical protein